MEAWIFITLGAALFQTLRSLVQRQLKSSLSNAGATFARFAFASPLALLYALAFWWPNGAAELPAFGATFWLSASLGGIAQILGTTALLASFSYRNFAVGVALSKTDVIQTVLFALVLLAEPTHSGALLAILLSLAGVLGIVMARHGDVLGLRVTALRPALLGLGAGAGFALSAVGTRNAALSLGVEAPFFHAACALAFTTLVQTLVMGLWLVLREPGQLRAVGRAWRSVGMASLFGVIGSAGWFTAMTLEHAPHVRALGQVELIFSILVARIFFAERVNFREFAGMVLLATGVLSLLLRT